MGTKGEYDDDDIENDASVKSYAPARQSDALKIEENIDGSVIGQDSAAGSKAADSRISQRASKASEYKGSRDVGEDEEPLIDIPQLVLCHMVLMSALRFH